jgi:NHS family nucleoside permease-like MFS transporter
MEALDLIMKDDNLGFGDKIGLFYSIQGIVSIFMPAIMGIIADKWIQAQRLLGICHAIAGAAMIGAGFYGAWAGANVDFTILLNFIFQSS